MVVAFKLALALDSMGHSLKNLLSETNEPTKLQGNLKAGVTQTLQNNG